MTYNAIRSEDFDGNAYDDLDLSVLSVSVFDDSTRCGGGISLSARHARDGTSDLSWICRRRDAGGFILELIGPRDRSSPSAPIACMAAGFGRTVGRSIVFALRRYGGRATAADGLRSKKSLQYAAAAGNDDTQHSRRHGGRTVSGAGC